MIVGVSCGHGGPRHTSQCASGGDCIACGTKAGERYGIIEADYVRKLGVSLLRCVGVHRESYSPPLVIILNTPGETISPTVRGKRAVESGCDVVLSLHVNESGGESRGAHMLHRVGDEKSIAVATAIAKAWPTDLKRDLHGHRSQGRYVAGMVEPAIKAWWPRAHALLSAYDPVPTVLVEGFYASRKSDCIAALEQSNQLQMVAALMTGIAEATRVCGGGSAVPMV